MYARAHISSVALEVCSARHSDCQRQWSASKTFGGRGSDGRATAARSAAASATQYYPGPVTYHDFANAQANEGVQCAEDLDYR